MRFFYYRKMAYEMRMRDWSSDVCSSDLPSYGIGQDFLVKEGNPDGIADYASIAENDDLKLAVMAGAVEVGYAKSAGVEMGQLVVLPDQSSLVKAVQAERANAAALTALSSARSEEHTSGLQSHMRHSVLGFCSET